MHKRILLAAGVALLSIAVTHGGQREPDLDIRFLAHPARTPRQRDGLASRVVTPPRPIADRQMTVLLVGVNPMQCNWDEPVTYDVEIKNISSQTVTLPWTLIPTDVSTVAGSPGTFPIASLALTIDGGGFVSEVEKPLWHPNCQCTGPDLAPAQSVAIRGPPCFRP